MATVTALEFKPDLADATRHWLAFWNQEIIDRPCCIMRAPKAGAKGGGPVPYMSGAREDFSTFIDRIVANAAATWHGGDGVPSYTPSFGPDMFAAWLGSELKLPQENFGTSWAVPCIKDWDQALPIRLDPNNYWWRRMLEFCRALAAALKGKMVVAHLDLHSNMDALLAMRGGEDLCVDMVTIPTTIDRAMRDVRVLYEPIYNALYEAANMAETGTCGWVPAYHPVRTNTIQCDFAALIGPEHFRRWVVPALEQESAFLGHCVYHLDGPECLVHLDDLCAIPHLDCIQWTTGARNKAFHEWMDLLKRIQAKGKSLWVPCDCNSIKMFHKELKPNQVFYDCHAPTQKIGEETLKWLRDNT